MIHRILHSLAGIYTNCYLTESHPQGSTKCDVIFAKVDVSFSSLLHITMSSKKREFLPIFSPRGCQSLTKDSVSRPESGSDRPEKCGHARGFYDPPLISPSHPGSTDGTGRQHTEKFEQGKCYQRSARSRFALFPPLPFKKHGYRVVRIPAGGTTFLPGGI